MKKVIKNKLYNTETSECVSENWNGLSQSDFRHMAENLYKTSNGNWFMHGSGGPLTKYCVSNGNWRD